LALATDAPALPAQVFRHKDFDAYVARGLQVLRTPGASIAVVRNGRMLFAKGYGVRTIGDTARVDAHTLFQIASNTKAFTTAALALLVDQGKLARDEPRTTTAFFTSSRNAATPHGIEDGRLQVVPLDSVDNISPAGGIASNVTDLARWLVCRLDSGRYSGGGGRLFSEAQAREMWSGQTILPIPDPPPPLAALRPNFAEYGL